MDLVRQFFRCLRGSVLFIRTGNKTGTVNYGTEMFSNSLNSAFVTHETVLHFRGHIEFTLLQWCIRMVMSVLVCCRLLLRRRGLPACQ